MLRHVNLAQVNLSRLRFPADSPELAEFVGALDRLNRVAEQAPGFVWRLPGEHLNGGALLGDPLVVVNVSVWESYPALHAYVYRSRHGRYLRRRAEWFEPLPPPTTARVLGSVRVSSGLSPELGGTEPRTHPYGVQDSRG